MPKKRKRRETQQIKQLNPEYCNRVFAFAEKVILHTQKYENAIVFKCIGLHATKISANEISQKTKLHTRSVMKSLYDLVNLRFLHSFTLVDNSKRIFFYMVNFCDVISSIEKILVRMKQTMFQPIEDFFWCTECRMRLSEDDLFNVFFNDSVQCPRFSTHIVVEKQNEQYNSQLKYIVCNLHSECTTLLKSV
jgi:uncharacterized protein YlaI